MYYIFAMDYYGYWLKQQDFPLKQTCRVIYATLTGAYDRGGYTELWDIYVFMICSRISE